MISAKTKIMCAQKNLELPLSGPIYQKAIVTRRIQYREKMNATAAREEIGMDVIEVIAEKLLSEFLNEDVERGLIRRPI